MLAVRGLQQAAVQTMAIYQKGLSSLYVKKILASAYKKKDLESQVPGKQKNTASGKPDAVCKFSY